MTCIVGVTRGDTVWMGGDRAATDASLGRKILKEPKVFMKGEIGFGVCGLPKVMDALQHAIELPKQRSGADKAFLVSEMVPALRDGLKRLDCTFDEAPHGTCFHGGMLVAYRGVLYELQDNFQLVVGDRGYAAVGSGGQLAMGSLAETWRINDPRKRVIAALEAAADGNAGVAPPFDVIVIGKGR